MDASAKSLRTTSKALGVNFRTLAGSVDSGKLSPRMRRALGEMVKDGSDTTTAQTNERGEALERRVGTLEEEVGALRETTEAQARQVEELERRLAELEKARGEAKTPDAAVDEREPTVWTPPKRAYGLPDPGGRDAGGAARRGARFRTGGRAGDRVAPTEDWRR